jgi:hypothetical protein
MLTLFTTAKPFKGHFAVIQNNALRSWKLLGPDVEIILFGDDGGSANAAAELGLRHEARVAQNEHGATLVSDIFERAQQIAKHDLVCYINCDIVLTSDFRRAAARLLPWASRFLMVGRRWDVDVTEPLDFSTPDWAARLTSYAQTHGFQRAWYNIDYFLFSKGLYQGIPPLAIGRRWWDNWLVWHARELQVPVVDASAVVCAVHQNHDYSHHALGMQGVWEGQEARQNWELTKGGKHSRTIEDATYKLTPEGFIRNQWYWLAPLNRRFRAAKTAVRGAWRTWLWHPLLNWTRPIRRALGLTQAIIPNTLRSSKRRHHQDV